MKKKVIALILYFALLLSSVFPATALAEGEPDAGSLPAEQAEAGGQQGGGDTPEPASTETPACTCTVKCSEGAVDSDCPVCLAEGAALAEVCKGAEPQPANEQGGGNTPANGQGDGQNTPEPTATDSPVCTCTAKCAEGAVNDQCPVCASDWSSCAFTEESGEPEPDNGQEPDRGTESVTVTEWSWVDEKAVLAPDGKLYLPSAVTAENLEGIKALLPQYIQAGEEKLALSWTYEESSGSFTAALPEGYALAEGAKPLSIETVVAEADTLENEPVNYIDENKQTQTCSDYTLVTADGTEWNGNTTGGWYVVNGSIEISNMVTVSGDVKLILTDGCTLTVKGGIEVADNNSFTIYAQANGSGALTVNSRYSSAIGRIFSFGGSGGTVTINGGTVEVVGGDSGFQVLNLTVNGGTVNANERSYGISCDNILTINGGTVNARNNSCGISSNVSISNGILNVCGNSNDGITTGSFTVSGGTVNVNNNYNKGINCAPGGCFTVSGGTVNVNNNYNIGINCVSGDINISGGTVNATGSYNGIYGSSIIISGGTVNAEGSEYGIYGTFSTGEGGTAIIYASGSNAAISDQSGKGSWGGIIFEGNAGEVYGNQSLSSNFVLEAGQTLTIPSGSSLTNTIMGTLTIDGELTNNGTFTNSGPVTVPMAGSFVDNGTLNCTYHSYNNGICVICGGAVVSGVSLDKTELELIPGKTATLQATVSPDNAANKDLTWSSNNESVATVNYDGTVTAHKTGTATITVTSADNSNIKAECTVTVLVPVSSVTMSRSSLRIYEGRGYTLSATVKPDDAANKGIVWSSSDESIATVDQKGNVIGKAPGVCTVYATAADGSGVYDACTVRVLRWYPGATPITGDSSNLGLWIGVLAVSACAIGAGAFILIKKRKKK